MCIFIKLHSKTGNMYLCLTVSVAGSFCLFSGSSEKNVCRPKNTLVVTKLCKYTSMKAT